MAIDGVTLRTLIEDDPSSVSDTRVLRLIRDKLVEPRVVLRDGDYGAPGQQYPCQIVLDDPDIGLR